MIPPDATTAVWKMALYVFSSISSYVIVSRRCKKLLAQILFFYISENFDSMCILSSSSYIFLVIFFSGRWANVAVIWSTYKTTASPWIFFFSLFSLFDKMKSPYSKRAKPLVAKKPIVIGGEIPRRGQFDQSAQQWTYLWKFAFPDGKWWMMELRIVGHIITVRLATKNKRKNINIKYLQWRASRGTLER